MLGYQRQRGRRNGGIIKIALAEVTAIGSVTYDRATGNAESIGMTEGGSFALYHFREDSAWFKEWTVTEAGFTKVERELGFTLERLDENERESVKELLGHSADGLVAIVWNGCGAAHLLGLSRRFDKAFPLKVKATELATGKTPADLSGEVVILVNEDTAKAPLFTGDIPLGDNMPTGRIIAGVRDTGSDLSSDLKGREPDVSAEASMPPEDEKVSENPAQTAYFGTGPEAADASSPAPTDGETIPLSSVSGAHETPQQDENL